MDTVGAWVSAETAREPKRARTLLELAYSYVDLKGRFARVTDVEGAVDRFNGSIAHTIVRALRRPEEAVLVNIFLPCELIHTLGLTPMFPEGIAVYLANTACAAVYAEEGEARGVPDSFCSYHKAMIGMVESGVLPDPLMVAHTTLACDANQVSFRRVAAHGATPLRVIDVPGAVSEDAVDYVADQLRDWAHELEDLSHRKLDLGVLKSKIAIADRTLQSMNSYRRLRGSASLPTTATSELCELIATHCLLGGEPALRYCQALESLAAHATRKDIPRIYWFHTLPNWQRSMREVFDGAVRCELVGCDTAFDYRGRLDVDRPFESMARRVVENVANGRGERRIRAALEDAQAGDADGAVIFCHWGCKQTMGLSQLAKEAFEAAGIPTLVLDGDGCDPRNVSDGQMVTRANAFLEQLEAARS